MDFCQILCPRLPSAGEQTDNVGEQNQWNCQTNPMELSNKINGIGKQNQWLCFLKTAEWEGEDVNISQ